ncbi:MAG TPA: ATP-binding protein [Gemmatimonadaceae bacterium]|nr:ATP-binding protein [Gemmatimonadaceae bacterium]
MNGWYAPATLGGVLALAAVFVAVSLRRAWRRAESSLAESEALSRQLAVQADELRRRVEESEALRAELELSNIELVEANAEAHHARASAEAAARRKEEVLAILDTVLDSSPVAFALYDRGLRFIRINRAFADLTGNSALDHIGASIDEVAPSLAPTLLPSLQRVLHDEVPIRDVELSAAAQLARPDGQPAVRRHWLASFYPVRTPRGGVLGVGALMLEVSERKSLEEQFRQAQKMEAVGRLAGGIAHDFNNLLTVMSSCSELLLRDLGEEDRRRNDVEEIRRAAQRAASLTRQLLAFSRKQILQPTMVDLNAVVGDMERMLRRVLGEDIALETALDPELGFVRADSGQVEQVLMNLVVNARDAMPHGGRIVVRTRNVAQPDGDSLVALEVRDEGIGIPSEALPYIFEPFYTTKEQGKGTGLGLSTVYGIVKQSGGDVEVDTTVGGGTTFRILLPRFREFTGGRPTSPARGIAARPAGTILLVEDEEAVRALSSRILRREGYTVYVAARVEEAEHVFAQHEQEIVLLISDLVLPGLGGIELAQRLRTRRPSLKVLLMSGYTDRDVNALQRDMDSVGFLQKPFTPDALLKRVSDQLGSEAGRRGAVSDARAG